MWMAWGCGIWKASGSLNGSLVAGDCDLDRVLTFNNFLVFSRRRLGSWGRLIFALLFCLGWTYFIRCLEGEGG